VLRARRRVAARRCHSHRVCGVQIRFTGKRWQPTALHLRLVLLMPTNENEGTADRVYHDPHGRTPELDDKMTWYDVVEVLVLFGVCLLAIAVAVML
jgi:hypothetical protein